MSEPASEQAEVPSWVPEKFRSNPEAFGKSYAELESKLTELGQHNAELRGTVDAWVNEMEVEPPDAAPQGRGQTLAQMQRLAEESAYMGAQRVVGAISAGRVPAPEDPKQLAQVASEMMVSVDPAWAATDPKLVASVLESRPELLSEERLGDLRSVVSDLTTASALARGIQAEQTLQAYQRAENQRDMKLQATTLTGAGGRMDAGEDDWWSNIKQAADKSYSSIRGDS